MPLALALPAPLRELRLSEPEKPSEWLLTDAAGTEMPLANTAAAHVLFQELLAAHRVPLSLLFLSVAQDDAGRHFFLCLKDVEASLAPGGSGPKLFGEDYVKELRESSGAVLLFARDPDGRAGLEGIGDMELCPKVSPWMNYDVIPEVSLGPTQKLMLCDEQTLLRRQPEERIFEHMALIVNCHQATVAEGFYKIGCCSEPGRVEVIATPVHGWFSRDAAAVHRLNDEIQERMWACLQKGSVAVHCLAGVHRAPCIVACHFLWRYYALGHKQLPSSQAEIYKVMQRHRHVEHAYGAILNRYELYLKRKYAAAA